MYQANVYMQSKSWVAPWHRFCYTCFNSLNKVFTVWIEQNFSNLTVFRLQLPTFRVNIHKTCSWQTDCSSNLDFWFQSCNKQSTTVTTLPRTQTSLFWWKCVRKGRREGAVYTLPMVPCGSSPVTRFALASAMRKTKRLRRRLVTTSKVTENKEQRLANWVSAQPSVQEKSQFQFPGVISKSLFWLLSFPCNFN